MSWVDDRARYEAIVHAVEPAVCLVTKDHWFWKVLAAGIQFLTWVRLMSMTYREFLDDYGTTIGPVVGSPQSWGELNPGYLVHEATHAADARKASLGLHPWAGLPFYGLAYLLVFLPLGLAWARYRLELRADTAAWRYELKHGLKSATEVKERAERRGESLRGGAYGYAWPWAVRGYRRRAVAVIVESGHGR